MASDAIKNYMTSSQFKKIFRMSPYFVNRVIISPENNFLFQKILLQ